MALTLHSERVCDRMQSDNAAGAQTGRRGGAGPAGGLLGGQDPAGRRFSTSFKPSRAQRSTDDNRVLWLYSVSRRTVGLVLESRPGRIKSLRLWLLVLRLLSAGLQLG